jgi:transposase
MGTRTIEQAPLWIAASDLPMSPGHPFYTRLNAALDAAGFDAFVEEQCGQFYAPVMGRPGLPPGRYFRLLLVGYFEGIDSERGIAWRAADSLAVRAFLGLPLDAAAPDHSTISRTRRLITVETHREVFTWVQQRLVDAKLLRGKTVGIDATTLEANAAMRSIVRRDTGEGYVAFLTGLAEASGIKTPTREALARLDRKRKKKGANTEWRSPSDHDARITKMKDGRTHLAHKAEHAVDLETGAIVALTLQGADIGDTTSLAETLTAATEQLDAVRAPTKTAAEVEELVADKGYHSNATMTDLRERAIRTYIAEPKRGRRKWTDAPEAQAPVYANRRRVRGARGKRLLRRRGEFLERPNAHLYETGGMRRTHLRGHQNIFKRLIVHAAGFNLSLLMRALVGVGKPRRLQGTVDALAVAICGVVTLITRIWNHRTTRIRRIPGPTRTPSWIFTVRLWFAAGGTLATDC